jgi:hypothetical protein
VLSTLFEALQADPEGGQGYQLTAEDCALIRESDLGAGGAGAGRR